MRKIIWSLGALVLLLFTGCRPDSGNSEEPQSDNLPVRVLGDYVVEILEDITAEDPVKFEQYMATHPEAWPDNSGCTAVCKQLGTDLVFGRNMDLSVSEHPVYVFYTTGGKYRTMHLFYSYAADCPDFATVKAQGVPKSFAKTMPWNGSMDILNEKGFYIEVNMRPYEEGIDGTLIELCPGTNPGKTRLFIRQLPYYLASRCATVDEAVALLDELDIYNYLGEGQKSWNRCFMVGDTTGNYGLIEFGDNKVLFTPKQYFQANFYIAEDFRKKSQFGAGYGRIQVMQDKYDRINSEKDIMELMSSIYYSKVLRSLHDGDLSKYFDTRSEFGHSIPINKDGKIDLFYGDVRRCTTPWMLRTDTAILNAFAPSVWTMQYGESIELKDLRRITPPVYWYTVINSTTNLMQRTVTLRCWESSAEYHLSL
ncbi:MAG: hypothetical protein KBS40_06505 [Bacteroidales bacterium]|nr:hypothetical protein [Bacteroidales bacterium]